jgi:hypothetical protein
MPKKLLVLFGHNVATGGSGRPVNIQSIIQKCADKALALPSPMS